MNHSVNIVWDNWSYTDEDIIPFRAWMQRCQAQGIKYVTFCPHASTIDKATGYNDTVLNQVAKMSAIAFEYGIRTILDLHTHMRSSSQLPWYMAGNFGTVFSDPTARARWLDLIEHVAAVIIGMPYVDVFHLMNEPSRFEGAENSTIQDWVDLFTDMYARAKATGLTIPLSVRIAEPAARLANSFNYDPRIRDIFDVVTINGYLDEYNTSEASYRRTLQWAKASGKPVHIGEYGNRSTNDQTQANGIQRHLDMFKEEGVELVAPWLISVDMTAISSSAHRGWNLSALDGSGSPRAAFGLLIGSEDMSVNFENKESGPQTLQVGKDETVTTFVPRDTVVVPAGETRTIELQPGERIRGIASQ